MSGEIEFKIGLKMHFLDFVIKSHYTINNLRKGDCPYKA